MTVPTPPAVSDAMRETVESILWPHLPLDTPEVANAILSGPIASEIARLTGEREAERIERQVAETEIIALRGERDAARGTNRELHRRLQAVEGPLQANLAKTERSSAFWLKRRKHWGGRHAIERRRAEAAEAETARLRAERDVLLEALRGVIRVADRKTVEFDRARAALASQEKTDA